MTEDDVRRIVREEIAKNNARLSEHLYVGITHFPPPGGTGTQTTTFAGQRYEDQPRTSGT